MKTDTTDRADWTEPSPQVAKRREAYSDSSRYLPTHVSVQFAPCGALVLRTISKACGPDGVCTVLIGDIAAEADCSIGVAEQALRVAVQLGFLAIAHRRGTADKVVTIHDATWRAMVADRRPRKVWR